MSISSPSTPLYAPINALPRLTAGRNGSGYAVGHEPKNVLDNNLDTWWTPDSYSDSAIYFDLGVSGIPVDAIALWVHNYNADFKNEHLCSISYSYDDITYTSFSWLWVSSFALRGGYVPIILKTLLTITPAQYWKLSFLYFNIMPRIVKPEISAVWFLTNYSLPFKAQPATNDKLIYNNVRITNPASIVSTLARGAGSQRTLTRQFILRNNENYYADSDHYWHKLSGAYAASRGGCLPVIIKPDIDSPHYRAVLFDAPFNENRTEHDNWQPQVTLRELGFKRVPFYDKTIMPSQYVLGLWHFRSGLTDESGNSYTWSSAGTLTYKQGIVEQEISTVGIPKNGYIQLTGSDAEDFNMGMNDFTIIAWWRGTSEVSNACIVRKAKVVPTPTTGGYFMGSTHGNKFRCVISDISGNTATVVNQGPVISGNAIDDNNTAWHQLTMTVNRSTNELKAYVDGVQIGTTVNIAHITGSINSTPSNFPIGVNFSAALQCELDELAIFKGVALPAATILTNYIGKLTYGTWGM